MSDLPLEGRVVEDKKDVPLTDTQRIDLLVQDVRELARGVNTQGALLEAIVTAFDKVVARYLELTRTPAERGVAVAEKPSEKDK